MSLKLGTTDVTALKLGTATVAKLMLGTTQVWPTGGPPTFFTDNFNRANGALGSSWAATAGSVVVNTNRAIPANTSTNDSVRAVTPGIGNNQWVEATITAADTYSWLVVRGNSDDSTRYSLVCGRTADGGKWVLGKTVGGNDADLAAGANGSGVTGTYRLEAEGTTIRAYLNGTKVAEVTDTEVTTGGIGFGFYTTNPGGSVDNFRGGDLPYVPPVASWMYDSFPTVPAAFRQFTSQGAVPLAVASNRLMSSGTDFNWASFDRIGTPPPTTALKIYTSVQVEWMGAANGEVGMLIFANNTTGGDWTVGSSRNMIIIRQNGTMTFEHESGGFTVGEHHPATAAGIHRFDIMCDSPGDGCIAYADGVAFMSYPSGFDVFRGSPTNHQIGMFMQGNNYVRVIKWNVCDFADGMPP